LEFAKGKAIEMTMLEQLMDTLATDGKFNFTADCTKGLALERWPDCGDFSRVFEQCPDKSIEVFWKTPLSVAGRRGRN
jgi:hypothetical protein